MSFWSGKRVLVTGGAGLIGSRITGRLVELGASVKVVDDLSKGSLNNLHDLRGKIEFQQLNLLNTDACKGILDGADVCFHLAAKIGGIAYFHKYPATSLRDNSIMCMNL
ncbi:NAD-dependent epimerase/dehydratase family protein [Candidatus Bathyarchaeota archaeon]|nr:NAD-dependent epimerase/dehydratase family protein [Candidatus Bathyarchaeota archaeon]